MHQQGHPNLAVTVSSSGLVISEDSPWLAASPDGIVVDTMCTQQGLVELKNPSSVQDMTISEASKKKGFCIKFEEGTGKCLDKNHNYYFQVQCQIYCTRRQWCDFVVRTNKDLYVERIYPDCQWWKTQLLKVEKFYFKALLPELACPRHHIGGIREPVE